MVCTGATDFRCLCKAAGTSDDAAVHAALLLERVKELLQHGAVLATGRVLLAAVRGQHVDNRLVVLVDQHDDAAAVGRHG